MRIMRFFLTLAGCLIFNVLMCCAQGADLGAKSKHGKELMASGKFEDAIPVYRDLVRALPNNPGPLMDLGLALHMAGHDREAVEKFRAALKLQPRDLPARLFLGAAYMGMKQPSEALRPLKTYLTAKPDDHDARLLFGQAFLSLDRYKEAIREFKKLSEKESQDPKVWDGLGLSYEGLANRNFRQLEKIAPGSAYWLVVVADSRVKAGQPQRAFYFYREALKQAPTMHGIHAAIAEIYRSADHPDWAVVEEGKEREIPALDCADKEIQDASRGTRRGATRKVGTDPAVASGKLECDFWAGHYEDVVHASKGIDNPESTFWRTRAYNELAKQSFKRLAELPPSAEIYELLARIHTGQKNHSAAVKDWQHALSLSPENPYYQQGLAISLSASGDHEHARPLLEDLLKHSPDSAELNYWLGFTLLSLEKPAEAVNFLEKAVKAEPEVLEAHRDLARTYLRLGRVEEAIPHFKAALPIDDDGSLYYQLAQAYRRTGQASLEKEMLKQFRDIQDSLTVEKKQLEQQFQITPP